MTFGSKLKRALFIVIAGPVIVVVKAWSKVRGWVRRCRRNRS